MTYEQIAPFLWLGFWAGIPVGMLLWAALDWLEKWFMAKVARCEQV